MAENIKYLGDTDFKEYLSTVGTPVFVDFYADWCGPCKMIAPVLEDVAGEYQGKVQIAKVNVDQSPAISREYNVSSIPTLVMFENGSEVERFMGYKNKKELQDILNKYA